jgi:nucleotide-binding universal stress UspA family protein
MFGRIVVALDGSPLGETILPYVERLAADTSLEVLLVTVGSEPPKKPPRGETEPVYLDQIVAEEHRDLDLHLEEPARRLTAMGVAVQRRVRIGDPATEIVHCAEEVQADAIAMSTHGRTGLDRLLHGSVAETILRTAHRPVLLFRPTVSDFAGQQATAERPSPTSG